MSRSKNTGQMAVEWDFGKGHPLVTQFNALIINHAKMQSTMREMMNVLAGKTDPGVVLLVGATGVGKSTLIDKLQSKLFGSTFESAVGPCATNPLVWTRSIPPQGSKFDWRDYITRALKQAGDVLTNRKVASPATLPLFDEMPVPVGLEGNSLSALRQALENCLRYRKTRYLVIDEAQYLLFIHDNLLAQQLETIKSLAEEARVVIILVGTYRLLEVQNQSAQLVRRSQVVAFSRYSDDDEEDVKNFAQAAANLYQLIPIQKNLDVKTSIRYLYIQSCGCVGILKNWFAATLATGIREKKEFNLALLKAVARANQDVLTMHREALEGESRFRDMSDDDFEIALTKLKAQYRASGTSKSLWEGAKSEASSRGKKGQANRAGKRVGIRKPTRDPVGDIHALA